MQTCLAVLTLAKKIHNKGEKDRLTRCSKDLGFFYGHLKQRGGADAQTKNGFTEMCQLSFLLRSKSRGRTRIWHGRCFANRRSGRITCLCSVCFSFLFSRLFWQADASLMLHRSFAILSCACRHGRLSGRWLHRKHGKIRKKFLQVLW